MIKYTDKSEALKAVRRNGYDLHYVSDELRNDKDVVLAAVRGEGYALQYASDELRGNSEVVLAAIQQNSDAISFAKLELLHEALKNMSKTGKPTNTISDKLNSGIVRRIDDLGRIVIPKEIRTRLGIHEGDPMEIATCEEGAVVLKKYIPSTFSAEVGHVQWKMKSFAEDHMKHVSTELKEEYKKAEELLKQTAEIMKKLEEDREIMNLLYDYN